MTTTVVIHAHHSRDIQTHVLMAVAEPDGKTSLKHAIVLEDGEAYTAHISDTHFVSVREFPKPKTEALIPDQPSTAAA